MAEKEDRVPVHAFSEFKQVMAVKEDRVPVHTFSSAEECRNLWSLRQPVVVRGIPLGPCAHLWPDPEYLADRLAGLVRPVHVTTEHNMNFVNKNFRYQNLEMGEVVRRAQGRQEGEMVYLRAISEDKPRSKAADLKDDFPSIAGDFILPAGLVDQDREFSRVFRVSSGGVRMWTHYDVMDNIYCQVAGHKRATLWSPDQADRLYLAGDKSTVVDIEKPDQAAFPLFEGARKVVADLQPGDVLFIPALWFHNMVARDFGVAVNVFWKELDASMYDPKDVYGNKDHLLGAKADRMLDNVMRQLASLPPVYRDFYGRRMANKLKAKCCTD